MRRHRKHSLTLVKLLFGIMFALWIAAQDDNGLSIRDLIVGGGTALATTVSVATAIETGTPLVVAGQISLGCLVVDVVTGVWLNLNPILDTIIRIR